MHNSNNALHIQAKKTILQGAIHIFRNQIQPSQNHFSVKFPFLPLHLVPLQPNQSLPSQPLQLFHLRHPPKYQWAILVPQFNVCIYEVLVLIPLWLVAVLEHWMQESLSKKIMIHWLIFLCSQILTNCKKNVFIFAHLCCKRCNHQPTGTTIENTHHIYTKTDYLSNYEV